MNDEIEERVEALSEELDSKDIDDEEKKKRVNFFRSHLEQGSRKYLEEVDVIT